MMTDLRHALRIIWRAPVLAVVVICSLGIGIGVNTAVFSWIQAIVLRPLPGVANATDFYLIEPRSDAGSHPGSSWREYLDLQSRLTSSADLLAYRMAPFTTGAAEHAERSYGLLVSGNYFAALRLRPVLGRFPRAEEVSQAGGAPIVVISHDHWQTRYNGSPDILGTTLRVNERPLTIVARVATASWQESSRRQRWRKFRSKPMRRCVSSRRSIRKATRAFTSRSFRFGARRGARS
jgi:hypothetical protein